MKSVVIDFDPSAVMDFLSGMDGHEAKALLEAIFKSVPEASERLCGIAKVAEAEIGVSRAAAAAERFIESTGSFRPSAVMDALTDRPRPGSKSRAREAFVGLLGDIRDLRREVEHSRPMVIVGSSL